MVGGRDGGVRVRLTVVDPSRVGARVDVEVVVSRGTPLRAVAEPLIAATGHPPGGTGLFVDGVAVGHAQVGLPPLLNGAIVTVGRAGGAPGRGAGTCGGLAELHVVAGPDAGSRHPLSPGSTRLGRGTGVPVRIADADVSRTHAEVLTVGASVRVRDLGSTNGTRLGAEPVGAEPVEWPSDVLLHVGASAVALRLPVGGHEAGGGPAATAPDGEGRLLVNPAPRLRPPPVGGRVTFPQAPPTPSRTRLPWTTVLVPLIVSVPLAWWLRQVAFLVFGLLSPLMVIVQYVVDRRARRGDLASKTARHSAETQAARAELGQLLDREKARLRLDHPDPATVAATATGPLHRLWERRAGDGDQLVVRLGCGDRPSLAEIDGSPPDGLTPPLLQDVPITVDLAAPAVGGVIGIAGRRRSALGLTRSLVGQAAVANSPLHLRVVVLTVDGDTAGDWAWAAWLPHADARLPDTRSSDARLPGTAPVGVSAAAAVAPGATRGSRGAREDPRVLVVLDGAGRLRRDPRVARLLASAGEQVFVLCLDDETARLPAECGATMELPPPAGDAAQETAWGALTVRGEEPVRLRPDLVSPAWAERLGRDLARLGDATPAGRDQALPAQVRLLDLLAHPDADAVVTRWARRRSARDRATTALVGVTSGGPLRLDLAAQGPHALVAGTTGAGKSELLTTLVIGLAVEHPPERLHLLLVDYKGGTAFGPLEQLPHTAGVLTDLDEHLARRALTSLRAELRRRERLLREAGAADVEGYESRRDADAAPMPRLVIVIDEFRVLAEELPDLLSGLVRVAVVGRSLGVHLVLATQRPAGVVTAEIRANVNLRIALRVRDHADSEDVVESPAAAAIPTDRPGRGVLRAGGGLLLEFQAARATGRERPGAPDAQVRPLSRADPVATAWKPLPRDLSTARPTATPPAHDGPDDLDTLVAACRAAAAREGSPPVRAPWLPPLPDVVRPEDLEREIGPSATSPITFGVVDLPQTQSRGPLRWAIPGQGHLAIVGAPGSGRTAALRAIARAASCAAAPVHVHVLDGASRLGDLEALDRVGTVVPVVDVERASRLLAHLHARSRTVEAGAHTAAVPVILLVDGWEQVLDTWLAVEHGRLVDELLRLARDGTGSGLRLAVTGGRALLGGPVAGVLTERLLLRAADPTDLVLAGVPPGALPARMPPGRALRILPGGQVVEAQVVLDDDLVASRRPAGSPAEVGEEAPMRLAALPGRLSLASLLATVSRRDGGLSGLLSLGTVPVGLGGDDCRPLGPASIGAGWLVAGAPGSGRSTALATAAGVLRAAGRPVVVVTAPGAPCWDRACPDAIVLPSRAVRSGRLDPLAVLDDLPGATLVIDDTTAVAGTAVEEALLARLDGDGARWPAGRGPHVIVGCTPGQAAAAFRGLLARLRSTGTGLLLAPAAAGDGEAFGVRIPIGSSGPPGRATVITGGGGRAVQIAEPGAP